MHFPKYKLCYSDREVHRDFFIFLLENPQTPDFTEKDFTMLHDFQVGQDLDLGESSDLYEHRLSIFYSETMNFIIYFHPKSIKTTPPTLCEGHSPCHAAAVNQTPLVLD